MAMHGRLHGNFQNKASIENKSLQMLQSQACFGYTVSLKRNTPTPAGGKQSIVFGQHFFMYLEADDPL